MIHASIVAGVVALGDRSFYLAIIFGTWCPFQGVRDMTGASCQRLSVWLGMVVAFSIRAFLVYKGMTHEELTMFDMIGGSCAAVLMMVMALKASCDLSWRPSRDKENSIDAESGVKTRTEKKNPEESTPLMPYGQEDRIMCRWVSWAFATALVMGTLVLPDGQVDRFVLQGATPQLDLVLGSIAGYTISTLIAAIIASILERTVPVKRLLFCNIMGLACLSLWLGSSTFMHFHKAYLAPSWREHAAAHARNQAGGAGASDAASATDASSLLQWAAFTEIMYFPGMR